MGTTAHKHKHASSINKDQNERKHTTAVNENVNPVPSPNASHFIIMEKDAYLKRFSEMLRYTHAR